MAYVSADVVMRANAFTPDPNGKTNRGIVKYVFKQYHRMSSPNQQLPFEVFRPFSPDDLLMQDLDIVQPPIDAAYAFYANIERAAHAENGTDLTVAQALGKLPLSQGDYDYFLHNRELAGQWSLCQRVPFYAEPEPDKPSAVMTFRTTLRAVSTCPEECRDDMWQAVHMLKNGNPGRSNTQAICNEPTILDVPGAPAGRRGMLLRRTYDYAPEDVRDAIKGNLGQRLLANGDLRLGATMHWEMQDDLPIFWPNPVLEIQTGQVYPGWPSGITFTEELSAKLRVLDAVIAGNDEGAPRQY